MSDIVIIGSGPAGVLQTALYAARARVQTRRSDRRRRTGPGRAHPELLRLCRTHRRCRAGTSGHRGRQGREVEFVTTEAVGLTYTDKLTVEHALAEFPADAVILATPGASRASAHWALPGLEGHGMLLRHLRCLFYRGRDVAVLGSRAPCMRYRPCRGPAASPCSRAGPR